MKNRDEHAAKNLHASVTQCFEAYGGTFHNPASVGGKEAADNEEMGIAAMGHTSAWNCRQAQGANGLLLVGAGGWEDLSAILVPLRIQEEKSKVGEETPTSFLQVACASRRKCLCRCVWTQLHQVQPHTYALPGL